MKKVILSFLLLISFFGFSQKVKIEDGFVTIEDKNILIHESKLAGMNNTFSDLDQKKLFFFDVIQKGSDFNSRYIKVGFIESNLVMTLSNKYTRKSFIKKLIEEGVLNLDGNINNDNIKLFVSRFNENIEGK